MRHERNNLREQPLLDEAGFLDLAIELFAAGALVLKSASIFDRDRDVRGKLVQHLALHGGESV